MHRHTEIIMGCALAVALLPAMAMAAQPAKAAGEQEFKAHCASCHPDGGNIINPARTLSQNDRKQNGVKTAEDIVRLIRKPGPGMTAFGRDDLSDKEAQAIAGYIIKHFR